LLIGESFLVGGKVAARGGPGVHAVQVALQIAVADDDERVRAPFDQPMNAEAFSRERG
jgi:hypothetical protein